MLGPDERGHGSVGYQLVARGAILMLANAGDTELTAEIYDRIAPTVQTIVEVMRREGGAALLGNLDLYVDQLRMELGNVQQRRCAP